MSAPALNPSSPFRSHTLQVKASNSTISHQNESQSCSYDWRIMRDSLAALVGRVSPFIAKACTQREKSANAKQGHDPLPPPPRDLIARRTIYEIPLLGRRVLPNTDTPLKALYRIYEHICLDQHLEIRNELEAFWYHNDWAVKAIPDPKDPDRERYAVLSVVPKLLCLAFNKRIELGLPRDAPGIITGDMMEEWKAREKFLEEMPAWAESAPICEMMLAIPHWDNDKRDFVVLDGFKEESASAEFAEKNVLVKSLHIHFM